MDNTIKGFHIKKNNDGIIKLNTSKMYCWHIPKKLRENRIQQGDIVLVESKNKHVDVLVMEVFREEFEETRKHYRRVIKIIEKAPKNDVSSVWKKSAAVYI